MRLLYFAWLKTTTGRSDEEVPLPDGVTNVEGLIAWQKSRGGGFSEAFANDRVVRVAVNQEYAQPADPVAAGDEVAFFPPVTGG